VGGTKRRHGRKKCYNPFLTTANNRSKTGYSHHILDKGHKRAHNINELEILEIKQKGHILNTLEKFHIFKSKKECNLLNEIQSDMRNPIFEVIEQTNQH
jgi:hypothetical protein